MGQDAGKKHHMDALKPLCQGFMHKRSNSSSLLKKERYNLVMITVTNFSDCHLNASNILQSCFLRRHL